MKLTGTFLARSNVIVISLALLLGLIPLGIYWTILGNLPTASPAQVIAALQEHSNQVTLLDVRLEQDFQARHIFGSLSLSLERILSLKFADDLQPALQGKTLYLVCDSGLLSAQATRWMGKLGIPVFNVRGGLQDWGRAFPENTSSSYSLFELPGGVLQEPFRPMSSAEQAVAALALLWIKPIYMLLSGLISCFLLLGRSRDLRLLGWSLLIFLVGEVFCALNYLFFRDNSYFAEYMHSYSMALAFGMVTYALLDGVDERLLHFSKPDARCALLPVCGPCVKYQPGRCGIRRFSQLLGVVLVILSFIPLLAPYSFTSYNTHIFTFTHYYTHPFVHQWYEARYSPVVAIFMICMGLLVMQLTPHETIHPLARSLLCLGTGFFGFGWFRLALGDIFAEALVWATVWEEFTELLFVCAVIYLLWTFRHSLLPGFDLFKTLKLKK